MNTERTIFSQVMKHLPLHDFRKCVKRYNGNHRVRTLSCLDQFLCMAFAQLTFRESLRDIEACLRAAQPRLYHMGIRSRVCRSTLADANEKRDCRIYADFAQILIGIARGLYADEDLGIDLKAPIYALDSSIIDLCLTLFPWARFRKIKAAIKVHTLLNLRGSIPQFIHITEGKLHDVNVMDLLLVEQGSFYVMDRGYTDYARLHTIHQAKAFFVIRAKRNLGYRRVYSSPVDKTIGLRCDQTGVLTSHKAKNDYPDKLRRVSFRDTETQKKLVFITNNFDLPPFTIAQLYKARWAIELFFKWIKQHLRIKAFYGYSPNAVKTQVWIAISVYLLVAIIKKRLGVQHSLYTILQILSVSIFNKTPLLIALNEIDYKNLNYPPGNQLNLFDS